MDRDQGRFVEGHQVLPGSEKGWFKKGGAGFKGKHGEESKIKMSLSQKERNKGRVLNKDMTHEVTCPHCCETRVVTHKLFLGIKRRKSDGTCSVCRYKLKYPNSGVFKKGNVPWNAGTAKSVKINHTKEWKEMRHAVFERDDYTCQICGRRGGRLHPDHIKPKALYPELTFILDNIRTLCVECHRKTDTYGWKTSRKKKD